MNKGKNPVLDEGEPGQGSDGSEERREMERSNLRNPFCSGEVGTGHWLQWLQALVKTEGFFALCPDHRNPEKFFCLGCCRSICGQCARDFGHGSQGVLQVSQYMDQDFMELDLLEKLVVCTDIEPHNLFHIKMVPLKRQHQSSASERPNSSKAACVRCGQLLQASAFSFCSLSCKVDHHLAQGVDLSSMVHKLDRIGIAASSTPDLFHSASQRIIVPYGEESLHDQIGADLPSKSPGSSEVGMMIMGQMPTWLRELVEQKSFFSKCTVDHGTRKEEKKRIFCVDCCCIICDWCISSNGHGSHTCIQVLQHNSQNVVPRADLIRLLLDIADIETHTASGAEVVYLAQSPPPGTQPAGRSNCVACEGPIMGPPFNFCSLACKVNHGPSEESDQSGELQASKRLRSQ